MVMGFFVFPSGVLFGAVAALAAFLVFRKKKKKKPRVFFLFLACLALNIYIACVLPSELYPPNGHGDFTAVAYSFFGVGASPGASYCLTQIIAFLLKKYFYINNHTELT